MMMMMMVVVVVVMVMVMVMVRNSAHLQNFLIHIHSSILQSQWRL
jgi:hypothetical protein